MTNSRYFILNKHCMGIVLCIGDIGHSFSFNNAIIFSFVSSKKFNDISISDGITRAVSALLLRSDRTGSWESGF